MAVSSWLATTTNVLFRVTKSHPLRWLFVWYVCFEFLGCHNLNYCLFSSPLLWLLASQYLAHEYG